MVYTGQQRVGVDPDREHEKPETSLSWQLFCDIETVRFILPGGSIFLEGVGVQPTVRILIDAETVSLMRTWCCRRWSLS